MTPERLAAMENIEEERRDIRDRRDRFAAAALTGVLARANWNLPGEWVVEAREMADKMIAELDATAPKEGDEE